MIINVTTAIKRFFDKPYNYKPSHNFRLKVSYNRNIYREFIFSEINEQILLDKYNLKIVVRIKK